MFTIRLLTAVFIGTFVATAFADESTTRSIAATTQPTVLTSSELSAKWTGEKDGVKAELTFRDGQNATWRLLNSHAMISADLKVIDEPKSGLIDLRADYVITATGEHHSDVIGTLDRGPDRTLLLSVLPAAEKMDGDYVKVSQISLVSVSK